MRPIKETLAVHLHQQASEADLLGLSSLATQLTNQLEQFPVRSSGLFAFASQDLESEIESRLWSSAIDVLNFHNTTSFDAREIQNIVSATKEEFLEQLRHKIGCSSPSGAFESPLPGEIVELVDLDVIA